MDPKFNQWRWPETLSPALYEIWRYLGWALADLVPNGVSMAQFLLAPFAVGGQGIGICYPTGSPPKPLLVYVSETLLPYTSAATRQHEILASVAQLAIRFQRAPFTGLPQWDTAPLTRFLLAYGETPFFPLGVEVMIPSLILRHQRIAANVAGIQESAKIIQGYTAPFLAYVRKIRPNLFRDEMEVRELHHAVCAEIQGSYVRKQIVRSTRDSHISKVSGLLDENRTPTFRAGRHPGRPAAGSVEDPKAEGVRGVAPNTEDQREILEYDCQPENDEVRSTFIKEALVLEEEIITGLTSLDEVQAIQSNEKTNQETHFKMSPSPYWGRDPYRKTLYVNLRRESAGVLKAVEIAYLVRGCVQQGGRSANERGKLALCILFAGVFCGWTAQLKTALVARNPPEYHQHPGLVFLAGSQFAHLAPRATVGRQKALDSEGFTKEAYKANLDNHFKKFEPTMFAYPLALHPAVLAAVDPVRGRRKLGHLLIAEGEYDRAIADLNRALHTQSPNSGRVTPGRLAATFHGQAASSGFDALERYVVSGRPRARDEMPLNYTRISVAQACRSHWRFVDALVSEIETQYEWMKELRGWR